MSNGISDERLREIQQQANVARSEMEYTANFDYWQAVLSDIDELVPEVGRLRALNAELLAALQHVVEDLDLPDSNYSALEREAIKHARAAIAKATEQ